MENNSQETKITKLDNGLIITEKMTEPKKAGKKPRPVWEVTGNITILDKYRNALYELGGRPYPRSSKWNFNFWDDPTSDIEALDDSDAQTFEEQIETKLERSAKRSERYSELADKATERSNSAYEASKRAVEGIPLGQPILVGHHSEKRHRRDIAKSHAAMDKSVQEDKKSQYYQDKAISAEYNAKKLQDLEYLGNRIVECEANIRLFEKRLANPELTNYHQGIQIKLDAEKEKMQYWQAKFEEAGGVKIDPKKIKKGDFVKRRGQWYKVIRVNSKTITHTWFYEGGEWRSKFYEISDHLTEEKYLEFKQKQAQKAEQVSQ